MTDSNDSISKRHNTTLWAEIKKLYESKHAWNYERIKSILTAEFALSKFPSESTIKRRAKADNWSRYVAEDNIKNFNNTYTPEFWMCVKAVYESNSKITYKRLCELVQNELQCDSFPSADAVNAKVKREDWLRLGELSGENDRDLKKLKRSVKNTFLNVEIDNNSSGKKVVINQDDEDEIDPSELLDLSQFDLILENQKARIKNLLMTSQFKQKKMAEIITKARKRLGTINEIGDLLNDQLITNFALLTSPDLHKIYGATEFVEKQNKSLSKTIMAYNELTFGRRESIKLELQMYGVGLEDLRVVDQDSRMKTLNDDTVYDEQKKRLREERESIAQRNFYINSGGLARDVDEEAKKRMMEAGMDGDDDVYDEEFEEIEG